MLKSISEVYNKLSDFADNNNGLSSELEIIHSQLYSLLKESRC
jgi:hypothetical protein